MDTAQLHAFIAVAKNQSFSKAAAQLHLTQPAISKRISTLENQLGQRLFDRIGHSVLLTAAGLSLLPRAINLLSEIEDMTLALKNLSGRIEGNLRIATSHHIGLRRLPDILRDYSSLYPHVTLACDFVDSEVAYAQVEQGDCELAIVTLPDVPSTHIQGMKLWTEVLVPVAATQHPLAKQTTVTAADLRQSRAVFLPEHTSTQQHIQHLLNRMSAWPEARTTSSYLESIAMLIGAGQGWAFLPDIMLDKQIHRLKTAKELRVIRQLGVVHHRERTLSNAAKAMLEMLITERKSSG